jgi:cysteine protease ATG4
MDSQKDFNENNDARNVEEEEKKIKENSDNSKYNDEINVQLERNKYRKSVSYYYYNIITWTSEVIIQAKEKLKSRTNPVWLLGQYYPNGMEKANQLESSFFLDHNSRIWITYRYSFEPILPSNYTSDLGWGCMLRSGQMLLANALIYHFLGRDWRINIREKYETYKKLIGWFMDFPEKPFSIHKIATLGQKYDKAIGEWFGPNIISQVLKNAVEEFSECNNIISICVSVDQSIYKDEILKVTNNWKKALVLLLPIRLGIKNLNPLYYDDLKKYFQFPQCIGIGGGKPKSSLYLIGNDENDIIYLDPHIIKTALPRKVEYNDDDYLSYRCSTIQTINISSLDPSMTIGFYFSNEGDFNDFCKFYEESKGQYPIFAISDKKPEYLDEDFDVISEPTN